MVYVIERHGLHLLRVQGRGRCVERVPVILLTAIESHRCHGNGSMDVARSYVCGKPKTWDTHNGKLIAPGQLYAKRGYQNHCMACAEAYWPAALALARAQESAAASARRRHDDQRRHLYELSCLSRGRKRTDDRTRRASDEA